MKTGAVAYPSASVVTVDELANAPLAPELGAVKVTDAPG